MRIRKNYRLPARSSFMKRAYRRISSEKHHSGKFLEFHTASYGSDDGVSDGTVPVGTWEYVRRVGCAARPGEQHSAGGRRVHQADAVEICATLRDAAGAEFLVLVKQYRPPLDAVTLEFPAGLIDEGEDSVTAALRELREETGFVARASDVTSTSRSLCVEPGLTNSCVHFVCVHVDEGARGEQIQDETEDIEVVLLPLTPRGRASEALQEYMDNHQKESGVELVVDGKLYTFVVGCSLAS